MAENDDWEFSVGIPGWLAGLKGDIGVGGLSPVSVDVPFSKILDHLDMVAALTLEARRGPIGFYVDGMYLKISAGGDTPGPLLNSAEVTQRQVIAEAGLTYRVWESPRGYLDLLAGARYIYMDGEIRFDVNDAGVRSVSHAIADKTVDAVAQKTSQALSTVRREIDSRVAAAGEDFDGITLKGKVRERIVNDTAQIIRDRISNVIEGYPHVPGRDGRLKSAIRQLVDAQVSLEESGLRLAEAETNIRAGVGSAAARARAKAQSALQKARKELAEKIDSAIKEAIPGQVSGSRGWVDPYVGLRTRYNVTNRLYLSARADIGGFGISSKLDWQAFGALGCQLTQRTSAELGYRYLSIDYEKDGFVYDAAMGGAFVGLVYKF